MPYAPSGGYQAPAEYPAVLPVQVPANYPQQAGNTPNAAAANLAFINLAQQPRLPTIAEAPILPVAPAAIPPPGLALVSAVPFRQPQQLQQLQQLQQQQQPALTHGQQASTLNDLDDATMLAAAAAAATPPSTSLPALTQGVPLPVADTPVDSEYVALLKKALSSKAMAQRQAVHHSRLRIPVPERMEFEEDDD
ncbi:hypothetical protein GQ42DRAFT_70420 [Ramicandelaber brevisporus]|nr:hypothetical protein GQ42DRAFT_70420 [Ramicandelaber brevisporus]